MNVLKLTEPMMHGPAVKRLQEMGDLIGCDTGPNDGIFGHDTRRAVAMIQAKLGLVRDGVCGPVTWGKLLEAVDEMSYRTKKEYAGKVYDIRGEHPRPKLYGRKRNWSEINGVVLHQTGCQMPESPMGWRRLNAHIGATNGGKTVIVNDYTDMIWHAHGLSTSRIGIEFEGNHPGVTGDLKTLWKGGGGPDSLNSQMRLAADRIYEILYWEFRMHGQKWSSIVAHRQGSASRRADPGSEIWQSVAMVWAKRLGLENYDGGPEWRKPKGLVIPVQWNPDYPGRY